MSKRKTSYDAMDAMLGDIGSADEAATWPPVTPPTSAPTDELPANYKWSYDKTLAKWVPRKRRKDYTGAGDDHESRNARYGRATTYRLPADLADEVAAIAKRDEHQMSDFAAAIIRAGLDAYLAGNVKVRKV